MDHKLCTQAETLESQVQLLDLKVVRYDTYCGFYCKRFSFGTPKKQL